MKKLLAAIRRMILSASGYDPVIDDESIKRKCKEIEDSGKYKLSLIRQELERANNSPRRRATDPPESRTDKRS